MFDSFSPPVRGAFASVHGVFAAAWLFGAAIQRVASVSPRACVWTFRAAGVGNRGCAFAALDQGTAFRVARVGNGGRCV